MRWPENFRQGCPGPYDQKELWQRFFVCFFIIIINIIIIIIIIIILFYLYFTDGLNDLVQWNHAFPRLQSGSNNFQDIMETAPLQI